MILAFGAAIFETPFSATNTPLIKVFTISKFFKSFTVMKSAKSFSRKSSLNEFGKALVRPLLVQFSGVKNGDSSSARNL